MVNHDTIIHNLNHSSPFITINSPCFPIKKLPWNQAQPALMALPTSPKPRRLSGADLSALPTPARRSAGGPGGPGAMRLEAESHGGWRKNTWEKHGQNHEMHHLINVSSLFLGLGSFFFIFWLWFKLIFPMWDGVLDLCVGWYIYIYIYILFLL